MTDEERKAKNREKYNKRYNYRKENNLCVRCGKNQPINGKALCEDCLAKQRLKVDREESRKRSKEHRDWCKAHNICPECGKNRPFGNHVKCAECLYKRTISNIGRKPTQEQKERYYQHDREMDAYREEHGLCKNCGKPLIDLQYKHCVECRNKFRKKQLQRIEPFRKRYKEAGTCLHCGKPRIDGKMYCAECYQKQCDRISYARSFLNRTEMEYV